ncbi:MAG TPA: hypothetical protein DCY56_06995 [Candidatus Omnitrophica bacterium]|nr:hypothetical protein [Candidatus Omnitrophota bacterium]
MEFNLSLKIAQIPCTLTCKSHKLFQCLEERLAGFKFDNFNKEKHISIFIKQSKPSKKKNVYIQRNIKTSSYSKFLVKISNLNGKCVFDARTKKGYILATCNGRRMTNFILFSLMEIYRFISPSYNSIAIHCSSVCYKNRGVIFAGPSGSGKSTIVKLIPNDYTVLHDELTFIKYEGERFYIHNPPVSSVHWDGLNKRKRTPLRRIFFLRKGLYNKVVPLSICNALKILMRNVYGVGVYPDTNKIFDICCKMINIVPTHILEFSKKAPLLERSKICLL